MNILDISPMWAVLAITYVTLLTMWYVSKTGGEE